MANDQDEIICKPTPWFIFRAAVILVMFSVFAVLFYLDGSSGYRGKNEVFYLHKTFQQASGEFSEMNSAGGLSPDTWKSHAASRTVDFPNDPSILPANLKTPAAWPEILHDYERMKPLDWKGLWLDYSKSRGFDVEPAEKPYDARAIQEQWFFFCVCSILASGALFFMLRTYRRSIRADNEAITTQQGRRIPYRDLKTLDLRKWDTKGLAFISYEGEAGKGRVRVDGLTYGGFKKEQGEPAEQLMRRIRSHFSGEILEYALLTNPIPSKEDGQSPA